MGAWGYKPQNSDSVSDLRYEINIAAESKLEEIYKKYKNAKGGHYKIYGYDFAGLVISLMENNFWIKYKYIHLALVCIEHEIRMTIDGNKRGWRTPKKLFKTAGFLAERLQFLLNEEKKFYVTTDMLSGVKIKKKNLEWRLRKLENSRIYAPVRLFDTNWTFKKY